MGGCFAGVPARTGTLGRSEARFPDGADNDSNCTDFRTANGAFIDPTPGAANFVTTVTGVPVNGTVSGTVPATLALTLGDVAVVRDVHAGRAINLHGNRRRRRSPRRPATPR